MEDLEQETGQQQGHHAVQGGAAQHGTGTSRLGLGLSVNIIMIVMMIVVVVVVVVLWKCDINTKT